MAEERQSFIDRLGPTLTSGLIVAFLSAASLGAVAVRDLVVTSNVELANVQGELNRIRDDFEAFKNPGGRFTKQDGDRHEQKLNDLDQRLRTQETRPPRLNPDLDKLENRVHTIELKQAEICERIKSCGR